MGDSSLLLIDTTVGVLWVDELNSRRFEGGGPWRSGTWGRFDIWLVPAKVDLSQKTCHLDGV